MRVLTGEEVKRALSIEEAIDVNRRAFESLYKEEVSVPQRLIVSDEHGPTLFKPAIFKNNKGLGIKIVGVREKNADKGIPTVPGTIILLNQENGSVVSMMDGTYLTALRTAAGSAAATQSLSREDSATLTVFGAGLQASLHIRAIACIRELRKVWIVNRNVDRAEKLRKEILEEYKDDDRYKDVEIKCTSSDNYREALEEADIIVTATNSSKPLFDGDFISKKGVHINAVGSYTNAMQELDEKSIKRSKVFIDDLEAMQAGDLHIPINVTKSISVNDVVMGTIGQLFVDGEKLFERNERTDVTIFKSVGTAAQDIATAQAVFNIATSQNIGSNITI